MSAGRTRRVLLWLAATDATFTRGRLQGREVLVGKCIHCNRRQTIACDGEPLSRATIEHIIPRNHGGRDTVDNLAIACAACNIGKGHRLDLRAFSDPTLQRVIATLQERRRERRREPPEWLDLPPWPGEQEEGESEATGDVGEPASTGAQTATSRSGRRGRGRGARKKDR
ncbi:MAG: HNH endonuclease [Myxococcales bacterium]|nr:HNH endonuclease [Myxococcales bacterium]